MYVWIVSEKNKIRIVRYVFAGWLGWILFYEVIFEGVGCGIEN
jgi:hypothetical protein